MQSSQNEQIKYHKINLTITRHGETEQNKTKTICGQQPGKLTQLGKKQAQKIGDYFQKEKPHFDYIYVSDLQRTKDTFTNIKVKAKYLDQIPTTFTKVLRQKGGGILQGKPLTAWKQEADKQHKQLRQYKCKNGESWIDVNSRVQEFIRQIIQDHIILSNNNKKQQKQMKKQTKKQTKPKQKVVKQQVSEQKNLSEQFEKLSMNQTEKQIDILAVSHGGYIMEMHNVNRKLGLKLPAIFDNSAQNCSIHKFQIRYPTTISKYTEQHIKIQCIVNNFTGHMK